MVLFVFCLWLVFELYFVLCVSASKDQSEQGPKNHVTPQLALNLNIHSVACLYCFAYFLLEIVFTAAHVSMRKYIKKKYKSAKITQKKLF
jgi:hypothetical protein